VTAIFAKTFPHPEQYNSRRARALFVKDARGAETGSLLRFQEESL